MEHWPVLVSIGLLHLLIVLSPGPNMWIVAQTALGYSGRVAQWAALGLMAGTAVWAVAASLGVSVLLAQAEWLRNALKIAGGAYLIYLGVITWRAAPQPPSVLVPHKTVRPWERLGTGFITVLTNPKSLLFFTSVFAAQLTPSLPTWVKFAAVALVVLNAGGWYTLLAIFFANPAAQRWYQRLKIWIDRAAGGGFVLFGAWLIVEAL